MEAARGEEKLCRFSYLGAASNAFKTFSLSISDLVPTSSFHPLWISPYCEKGSSNGWRIYLPRFFLPFSALVSRNLSPENWIM